MIINALCDYYDALADDPESGISPYGYGKTMFNYFVVLTEGGELSEIIKLDNPQTELMPTTMKISGIAASPVCDNAAYIFGVDGKKGENKIDKRKFETAKELHLRLFETAVSKEAIAVKLFFETWNPDTAWENEHILDVANEKGNSAFGGNMVFRLKGNDTEYFHNCDEIKNIWLAENERKVADEDEFIAQCSVTGEELPIARIHTQLSGVRGAQATGASLVSFKLDSFQSYNLSQSYNSRVSKSAEFKYTTVLNHLLKSDNNKLSIGKDTVVFWAYSPKGDYDEARECEKEASLMLGNEIDRATEEEIKDILTQGKEGISTKDIEFGEDINFYVLGLAPNAGRVSVRYFYRSNFKEFCDKINKYYEETQIVGLSKQIKVGSLIYATVSSKSKSKYEDINPLLGGAVMRTLLSGNGYPMILFNQVILRSKVEASVTQARAAAIKAYLIRNQKEEWLSMYLNEESKNTAYVLGRTFAILEMIQKNAAGGSLNATIKDKYFATACSNPALVFPTLLKLAQHHLAKIEGNYLNIQLGNCLALLEIESFPKIQSLEKQGTFILGYYQQNQKLYEKREDK